MKLLFILSAFILSTVNGNCQTEKSVMVQDNKTINTPSEDVLVLKELEFDFGKIPQGKPVTHVFEVINNGKDSLKIGNVQASCGCTTPEWERDKVQAPGKKTVITVGYNAASEGPFSKFITIVYNGTLSKQITIKGEVWKTPISSAPENKDLKNLDN
jgi:hypothetical protein